LGEIYIEGSKLNGRRICNLLKVSEDLKRFIKTPEMFVEYDVDIYADKSILNIPITATILPLAWLTGSDLYVDTLDRTFKENMDKLQLVFKEIHPDIPFTTEIHAKKLIDNAGYGKRQGFEDEGPVIEEA